MRKLKKYNEYFDRDGLLKENSDFEYEGGMVIDLYKSEEYGWGYTVKDKKGHLLAAADSDDYETERDALIAAIEEADKFL